MRSYFFVLLSLTLLLGSCDKHIDFPDNTMKIGHVLCTDGKVLSYDFYKKSDKEAIAVVFSINTDKEIEGEGYAVYLRDLYPEQFADSLGVAQKTSADITAHDGNANTFSLYNSKDVESPMAIAVFDLWRYGQSAYIPSVAQMRLLYISKEYINPIIEKLGGSPIVDEPDDCWYWTSTEVKGQETAKSWLYSLGSGAMQETPKIQSHKIRPIVTINK